MKIGKAGQQLIERWEGRRNTAYTDTAGLWTIGVGHLIKPAENWMKTATLTDPQIDDLFRQDIAWAEAATARLFPKATHQSQFDALTSFIYNLGAAQVESGTLDDLIRDGATPEAISAKWMQYNRSGGAVTPGLVARRADEVKLYWSYLWRAVVVCLIIAASMFVGGGILLIA